MVGFETVLKKGETFALRSLANYYAGGSSIDVTDRVHPDNQELAIRVAEAMGIDVAGLDFVTTDIGRSYREIGGAIIEANTHPGLRVHAWPAEGEPRDVGGAIIESMYPPGATTRVPVALIFGARGSESGSVAGALNRVLRSTGTAVARSTGDGASVNSEPAGREGVRGRAAIRSVLRDPRVEALIDTLSPRRVARRGLSHDACEVAAIMDTGEDGDLDELRHGLGVVVRATRGKLVVAADNKAALELVRDVEPTRLVLVSRNAGRSAVRRHLEAGGQTVVAARDHGERVIALDEGDRTILSVPVADIADLGAKPSRRRLKAHLFAIALAHGMGLSADQITSALRDDPSA